jgi:ribosome-associated heat shock protein Hsp15
MRFAVIRCKLFSALQIIFLFFLQENDLRKALIPFIGTFFYCAGNRIRQDPVSGQSCLAVVRNGMRMHAVTESDKQARLDKWLWAARFFKTRTLAAQAVSGGKVQVNGSRVKSSRVVQVGEVLRIRRGVEEFTVTVLALSLVRRPAVEARLLYEESEESMRLRQESARMRALLASGQSMPAKRPDKRDRRKIREFTRKDEG